MICAGIDIGKDHIVGGLKGQTKQFENNPKGHQEFFDWAQVAESFCMEATGRFHIKLAN